MRRHLWISLPIVNDQTELIGKQQVVQCVVDFADRAPVKGVADQSITVNVDGAGDFDIAFKDIAAANLEFEFEK